MSHIPKPALFISRTRDTFKMYLWTLGYKLKEPYTKADIIILVLTPLIFALFLIFSDNLGDGLVGLFCGIYLAFRLSGRRAFILALIGFTLSPLLFNLGNVDFAKNVARYTFYILLTAIVAELISVYRPTRITKRRTRDNIYISNTLHKNSLTAITASANQSYDLQIEAIGSVQTPMETLHSEKQLKPNSTKQATQQRPQAKPPTKRKLIQG